MKLRSWRTNRYVDKEIDIFDYKDEIIQSLSDKELEDELKRRKEENDSVTESRDFYYIDVDIDISDYADEALETLSDRDLINELESRGKYVISESENPTFTGKLSDLATYLGLRWWSTKEQVMKEINYYINNGK